MATPTDFASFHRTTLRASMTSGSQTSGVTLNPLKDPLDPSVLAAWQITGAQYLVFSRRIKGKIRSEIVKAATASIDSTTKVITLGTLTRNVTWQDGGVETSLGAGYKWPAGTSVELRWVAQNAEQTAFRDVAQTFSALITFSGGINVSGGYSRVPVYADESARDAAIPSPANGMSAYVTSLGAYTDYTAGSWATRAAGSTPNAADTTAGKVDIASATEMQNGTATDGTSGALNVVPVSQTTKTSAGAGDHGKVPVLDSTGKLAAGFLTANTTAPVGSAALWFTASPPTKYLLCDGSAVSRTTYSELFAVISTTYGTGDGSTTFNVPNLNGRFPLGAGTGTKVWTIASVDDSTEIITVPSNTSLYTGQAVVYNAASPAGGLSDATTYYVIRASATTIKLAVSQAAAAAGTAINITTTGSGTQTLTQTLTARTLADITGEETHTLTVSEIPQHTHTFPINNTTSSIASGGGNNVTRATDAASNATPDTSTTGSSVAHNIVPPALIVNFIIKAQS